MLMLEHKDVPYRRVEIVTLLHPVAVRLRGFDSGGQTRRAGSARPVPLRWATSWGLSRRWPADGERISTNYRIARFLDDHQPEPRAGSGRSGEPGPASRRPSAGPTRSSRCSPDGSCSPPRCATRQVSAARRADGRLGHLLYRQRVARRVVTPSIGRHTFATRAGTMTAAGRAPRTAGPSRRLD